MVVEITDSLSQGEKSKVMENEGGESLQVEYKESVGHHCGAHGRDVFDGMKIPVTRQILSFILALMG
ncbi:hypothetical protein PVK06_048374 [Gossypium arboreum]|uniref:Uncharacterized protein n=1 Tax=Gossypium arboreum TaxID=29729 RepID=A0ABR0MG42_GOSAR|nr:hypothetical protein PVK06_048374 [Gossypium arboreum]